MTGKGSLLQVSIFARLICLFSFCLNKYLTKIHQTVHLIINHLQNIYCLFCYDFDSLCAKVNTSVYHECVIL